MHTQWFINKQTNKLFLCATSLLTGLSAVQWNTHREWIQGPLHAYKQPLRCRYTFISWIHTFTLAAVVKTTLSSFFLAIRLMCFTECLLPLHHTKDWHIYGLTSTTTPTTQKTDTSTAWHPQAVLLQLPTSNIVISASWWQAVFLLWHHLWIHTWVIPLVHLTKTHIHRSLGLNTEAVEWMYGINKLTCQPTWIPGGVSKFWLCYRVAVYA